MRLRVLDFGTVSPLRSQAVYHGVAEAMARDDDPVLTLVSPDAPYVCVGLHQEIALEVDEPWCQAHGLPIIRRHVGGGAVLLDGDQLFFHFIFPRHRVPGQVLEIYPRFIEPVVRTYQALGVDARFRPINDIHVRGRKIGGTGAAHIGEAVVMVGSFLFDFDTETMARCLRVPSEKFRDKLRQGLDDYMTTLRKELGAPPPRARVQEEFLRQVALALEVEPVLDAPRERELAAIEEAERELADPEWTYQLGRKFVEMGVKIAADTHLTEAAHKAPGGLLRVQLLAKDGHIADLLVSGDFTCWPEDGVLRLDERLRGLPLERDPLLAAVARAYRELDLQIPGVEPEDVVTAILNAVHRE